jgi:hypothetical protein
MGIIPEARVRWCRSRREKVFAICRRRMWLLELLFIAGGRSDIRLPHSGMSLLTAASFLPHSDRC